MVDGLIVPYRGTVLNRFRVYERSCISDVAERSSGDTVSLLEAYLRVFRGAAFFDKIDIVDVVRGTALDSVEIVDDVKGLLSSSSVSAYQRELLEELLCLVTPEVNSILEGSVAPQGHLYYANINLDERHIEAFRDVRLNRTLLYNPAFELSWFRNKDGVPYFPLNNGFGVLGLRDLVNSPCVDSEFVEAYGANIPLVLRSVVNSGHVSREVVFSYVFKALTSCDFSSISSSLRLLCHFAHELDSIGDVLVLLSFCLSLDSGGGLVEKVLRDDRELFERVAAALGLRGDSWDGVAEMFLMPVVLEALGGVCSRDEFVDMSLRLSGLEG